MADINDIESKLDSIQFLSPNEPITPDGIMRILSQLDLATQDLENAIGKGSRFITMWNPNVTYSKDDMVLYFKQENEQKSPEIDKREFAFILVSASDNNSAIPNYDMVDGIPDFTKTNWTLLNPMSYLLQDLIGMREVVKEVFNNMLSKHVAEEHGMIGVQDISHNLVRKDYLNLTTPWDVGKYAVDVDMGSNLKLGSNGIMEWCTEYSYDTKANQRITIQGRKYFYQKQPIWDLSDNTIFSHKYVEDNLFSVNVNPVKVVKNGQTIVEYTRHFNNLRYGTNIFTCQIQFPRDFLNDEYMVFFDSYGAGEFVFGYDKEDLQAQEEPTWDAIVSQPMLMNKTQSGFTVVLPIHTHFNSMKKYHIGVPWNNKFRLQVIGRYR